MIATKIKLRPRAKSQRGMMLLEGLIAILIFSLGILAMVGMQAVSIGHTSQAKYRIDAAFAANKLIGRVWADRNARLSYANGGAGFTSWKAADLDPNLPVGLTTATVTVVPIVPTPMVAGVAPFPLIGHRVTINIQWRLPNESASAPAHVYVTTTDVIS